MQETIIPILAITVFGLCVLVPFYLRYLTHIRRMETLVKLAEHGADIKADSMKMFNQESSPVNDMRRGALFIALSLPIIASLIIGGDAQEAILFGGIPLCIGIAYLLVMKYDKRQTATPANSQSGDLV